MKLRTLRLRRVAAAAALGVGAVGGAVGLAAGTSGAAGTTGATIASSGSPTVASTGSHQTAGTLSIHLPATTATGTFSLAVSSTGATTSVTWASESVVGSGGHATYDGGNGTTTITIKVTGAAQTVSVSGIAYTTTAAHGTITVTPTTTTFTFRPKSVVNAKAPAAPTPVPGTQTLRATSTPRVAEGAGGQAAGDWKVVLSGTAGTGWTTTGSLGIVVNSPAGATTNCSGTDLVVFTGTPTVSVSATDVSTTPTVKATLARSSACPAGYTNVLDLTFTNSGTLSSNSGSITLSVGGVKYKVGSKATTGNVYVGLRKLGTATFGTASNVGATSGPSNADVAQVHVTANTPAVTVPKTAVNASISPIDVVESKPDTVSAGYVCISLSSGTFNTSASAKASVTKGNAVVTSKVVYVKSTGITTTTTSATAHFARFQVKTTSTGTGNAATFQVSGLAVTAGSTPGAVTATVVNTATANCSTAPATLGSATAYTVATSSTRVYGATADATAAAEFARAYPHTGGNTCPSTRAAVVATTVVYQDALSSQYLAQDLHTGTLLTPTTSLAQVTVTALRREGISTVYIVGGPLAVTTTVANAIKALHVYNCGGTTETTTSSITVHRLYGQTQYGTAMQVAEYVGAGKSLSFTGAYSTTNATGGSGRFNDTAAKGTSAPLVPLQPTAILASGQEFQDAQSASVVSYHTDVPMLLTPATTLSTTAVSAIQTLGIKQVVLMGGPLAVTNTVEAALVAKTGVTVVRVAGKDYTDTARELATFEMTGTNGLGWNPKGRVLVARGNGFTDGIAGAVLDSPVNTQTGTTSGAGSNNEHPLLLTETPTVVGGYLTTFLEVAGTGGAGIGGEHISSLTILGGPLAVSAAEVTTMQTDLKH